jgi:uncharacterized protein YaeQ
MNGSNPREKLVLESKSGESARHIALKILAYTLFRDEAAPLPLRIEQGVGQRHKPDLVTTAPETGAVQFWIDCGQIEVQRLGRIATTNRQARIVVLKPSANEARLYARSAAKFLPDAPERRAAIRIAGFDEGFLADFLAPMRGTNDLTVTKEEDGRWCVTINETTLLTALTIYSGAAIP